jgi:hypothetical protein
MMGYCCTGMVYGLWTEVVMMLDVGGEYVGLARVGYLLVPVGSSLQYCTVWWGRPCHSFHILLGSAFASLLRYPYRTSHVRQLSSLHPSVRSPSLGRSSESAWKVVSTRSTYADALFVFRRGEISNPTMINGHVRRQIEITTSATPNTAAMGSKLTATP